MNIFLIILIFYFGTAIGSFLSVLIHRYNEKNGNKKWKKILLGRSMCPHCKTELGAMDLVPLASYILLKGQCKYCEKEISSHYFFIELITGIIFALIFIKFPFLQFFETAPYWEFQIKQLFIFTNSIIISSALIAIFFNDLFYKEIPDIFSLPAAIIALENGILFFPSMIPEILIGGAAGGLFFQLQIMISKGKWVGSGDVRLGILMGIMLGWKLLIIALFAAYMMGSLIALYLLIKKKVNLRTAVPFGPYLVLGTLIAFFAGEFILNWYINSLLII